MGIWYPCPKILLGINPGAPLEPKCMINPMRSGRVGTEISVTVMLLLSAVISSIIDKGFDGGQSICKTEQQQHTVLDKTRGQY